MHSVMIKDAWVIVAKYRQDWNESIKVIWFCGHICFSFSTYKNVNIHEDMM